ncbi:MAG: nucleotidyltransferase domain-containing protein [Bacteroidota bacterium]
MIAEEHKELIIKTLASIDPRSIGVFGSYARNEETTKSDLDILIDPGRNLGMLELVRLENELSQKLGIKVDLVTKRSLKNKKLRELINQDLRLITSDQGR